MKKSQQGKPSPPDESQSHTRLVKDGQSTRIVGFDPGLNITGYGVIEVLPNQQVQLVEAGTIRPKSKDDIQDSLKFYESFFHSPSNNEAFYDTHTISAFLSITQCLCIVSKLGLRSW